MGDLSFCKLSYTTFKRLNSCESGDFCESSDFCESGYLGPLTRSSATLSPGRGFENSL